MLLESRSQEPSSSSLRQRREGRDVRVIYQGPEEQQEFSSVQSSAQPPGGGDRGGQINNRGPKAGEKETLER